MADIQLEHGYTRIADQLLESLASERLPAAHLRALLALIRLTYGKRRKAAQLSISDLTAIMRSDERTTRRILEDLVRWRIVRRLVGPARTAPHLGLEKDVDRWRISATSAARRRGARERGDSATPGRPPRRATAPGRPPRSPIQEDSFKKERQKAPAAAGARRLDAALDQEIAEVWSEVLEVVARYRRARWGKLTPRRLARCREIVRAYPERGARVLVEIPVGYIESHRKHGKGFDPAARMTPSVLYGDRADDYVDAFDSRAPPAPAEATRAPSRRDQAFTLRAQFRQRRGREPDLEDLRAMLARHGLEDQLEALRPATDRERQALAVISALRRSRRRFPPREDLVAALVEAGLEDLVETTLGPKARKVSAPAKGAPAGGALEQAHA